MAMDNSRHSGSRVDSGRTRSSRAVPSRCGHGRNAAIIVEPYHWPPELLRSLIDVIPLLCRSKQDVVAFLRGAGVGDALLAHWRRRITEHPAAVRQHEMVRDILEQLNERGDAMLEVRREVLKRVCDFEDFSLCRNKDALRAKGLVATIRDLVNRKDSFTRMRIEQEREKTERQSERMRAETSAQHRRETTTKLKDDLFALFGEQNEWRRGKALESVLNRWFASVGVLIRDAFVIRGSEREGIVEQIDGMIELQGHLYLVEMKWHRDRIGTREIAQHLVRVFTRGGMRGIFIASPGYTDAAIVTCRESLGRITIVLCDLEELVLLLEYGHDLERFLRRKIEVAVADRDPYRRLLCTLTTGP